MRALTASAIRASLRVARDVPKPALRRGQILVAPECVALNPTEDWKAVKAFHQPGVLLGCDFAGICVESNCSNSHISVGDRVAGCIMGNRNNAIGGSFAEYLATDPQLVWKVPDRTPLDEAASIGGIGSQTALMALHMRLGIPLEQTQETPKSILIWAGSTSVGINAIQLAKAAGLQVVTTASPKNHEYLRSIGADHVFDYRDPKVAEKVKQWAGSEGISHGLDCISGSESIRLASSCMNEGGTLVTLLPPANELSQGPVKLEWIVIYTMFDHEFSLGGKVWSASAKDREDMVALLPHLSKLVQTGQLKSGPVLRCPGGLEGIPNGLKYLEEGRVSASKLVYSIKQEFSPVPPVLQ